MLSATMRWNPILQQHCYGLGIDRLVFFVYLIMYLPCINNSKQMESVRYDKADKAAMIHGSSRSQLTPLSDWLLNLLFVHS